GRGGCASARDRRRGLAAGDRNRDDLQQREGHGYAGLPHPGRSTSGHPVTSVGSTLLRRSTRKGSPVRRPRTSSRGPRTERCKARPAPKLPELLLIEALRLHLATTPAVESGWVAALRDPMLAAAMAAIHQAPERKWTVPE